MTAKRGSRLNKSESVQVRFDPILKMAAEIAAGRERRSLGSFVEWCVEQGVRQVVVSRDGVGNEVAAWAVATECWARDDFSRLMNVAGRYPDLLTIGERKIIDAINFARPFFDEDFSLLLANEEGWRALTRYADDGCSLADVVRRLRQLRLLDREQKGS